MLVSFATYYQGFSFYLELDVLILPSRSLINGDELPNRGTVDPDIRFQALDASSASQQPFP